MNFGFGVLGLGLGFWVESLGITPPMLRAVLRRGEAECLQERQELARAERVLSMVQGLGCRVQG